MTEAATYTGDLLLLLDENGDWDINYINGQPEMTDGFDTEVMLAVFGEPDFWQNDLTNDPAEKFISDFPALIKKANVSDKTLKDGIEALKKALSFMVDKSEAQSIEVTGEFLNVYGIGWTVVIERPEKTNIYDINWEKGVVTIAGIFKPGDRAPSLFKYYTKLTPAGDTKFIPAGNKKIVVPRNEYG